MTVELLRNLRLLVLRAGSTILLACLLGLWIQHVSRNEAGSNKCTQ